VKKKRKNAEKKERKILQKVKTARTLRQFTTHFKLILRKF